MELRFLGRGSAFYPAGGNTSVCIRQDDQLLLLDCGETVFETLMKKDILRGVRQVRVAVSHLHGDHCGSLGTFVLYCRQFLPEPACILVPEDEDYQRQLQTLLTLFGNKTDGYRFLLAEQAGPFAGVRDFRYLPTVHAPGMQCYSFSFETEQGSVFYSADTCTTGPMEGFLASHPDVLAVYTEATDAETSAVHLPLKYLAAAVPPDKRSLVRLMHIGGEAVVEKGRALGFETVKVE